MEQITAQGALSKDTTSFTDDDGPYIAATRFETFCVLGLPLISTAAMVTGLVYGIKALRAWWGA